MGDVINVTFNVKTQTEVDSIDVDLKELLEQLDKEVAEVHAQREAELKFAGFSAMDIEQSKEDYKELLRATGHCEFDVAKFTKELYGSI